MFTKEKYDTAAVAINAIQLGSDIVRDLAGDQLDGNEMQEIESVLALELNQTLLEKR